MEKELHVVVGASGAIGQAVILELKSKSKAIRAVERKQKTPGVESVVADMAERKQALEAITGASHVYLCLGLPYNKRVWKELWPKIIGNVIEACEATDARLIFFDNVYMYGPAPLNVPFDEKHEQNPATEKGKVRKVIADLLLEAHHEGRLKAVIGRSADFYGPNAINSPFYQSFLDRMLTGKEPQFLGKIDIQHTYAYTIDNGKALVALAADEATYGQVWHLPVSEPVTMSDVTKIFNKVLGTDYKVKIIPKFMLGLLGMFVPIIKELSEMLYQFNHPYIMNYNKFQKQFPEFSVTPMEEAVNAMIESFKSI